MKLILNHYIVLKDQIYNKNVNIKKLSTEKAGQRERKEGERG